MKKAAKKAKAPAKRSAPGAARNPARKALPSRTEIVVRVDTTPAVPTTDDLAAPMTADGSKALTIRKSWLSESQLHRMLQRTPREQVYRRKGKGGQAFDYVTGSYCVKWLNFIFAWDWDFEVVEHGQERDHVWALGKLTVRGEKPGQAITKTQFGRSDVKQLKSGGNVDYGNDLKAAATDAMKKCASMLGFASDVYGKGDYRAESGQEPAPPRDEQRSPEEPAIGQGEETPPEFEDHVCQWLGKGGCGRDLTKAEAEYSKRLYGRELCREHYPNKQP